MTTLPHRSFSLTVTADRPDSVCVKVNGQLDHESADLLVNGVTEALADHPAVHELRLDLAQLDTCDAMGLSALLMVHRRTSAAGTRLHLDSRPPGLERMLAKTGTLHHFTAHGGAAGGQSGGGPTPRGETEQG